jgi:hypothetical protein
MAKKHNLKAEKAKRNKAYALKYKKRRPAFGRPMRSARPAPSAAPAGTDAPAVPV